MKVKGNGQAKVLSADELRLLFAEGFLSARDKALFGVCLYTGCRIGEALALTTDHIQGRVVVFPKAATKGKLASRTVDITPALQQLLDDYNPAPGALFPGQHGRGFLTRATADLRLKQACHRVGLKGVSTHSFRRTALTMMANASEPLSVIRKISGHKDLGSLQRYLEVTPEQTQQAVSAILF